MLSRSGVGGIFFQPKGEDKRADARYMTISLPNKTFAEVKNQAEKVTEALGLARFGGTYAVRCKREDGDSVRAQLLPETAFVEVAPIGANDTLYVVRNTPQVTRDELTRALENSGWQGVTAIRPQGVNRWLVAAKQEPVTCHVAINGTITVIEALQKRSSPVTVMARAMQVETTQTLTDSNQQTVAQVSTSTRMAEIKTQLELQVAEQVEAKLSVANSKIQELSQALNMLQDKTEQTDQTLSNDMQQMKAESAFNLTKLQEVEQSVASSGSMIVKQMEGMLQAMQSNLQTNLQANMEQMMQGIIKSDSEKRLRTEEPPKVDAFATKS